MEEKETVSKPVRRTKKAVADKEVETNVIEETVVSQPVQEKKTTRKRLNQIDVNELIPVRSLTNHKLVYVSKATGARYVWSEYGSVEYLTFGEINTMRSQYPKFIKDCLVLIEDDDVIELFNLDSVYENVYSIEELDNFFKKSNFEIEELIKTLPHGVKKSLVSRAKELIENEELTDYRKIKTLETQLNVDLTILLD